MVIMKGISKEANPQRAQHTTQSSARSSCWARLSCCGPRKRGHGEALWPFLGGLVDGLVLGVQILGLDFRFKVWSLVFSFGLGFQGLASSLRYSLGRFEVWGFQT